MKSQEFKSLRNSNLPELKEKKVELMKKFLALRTSLKLGQLKNYSQLGNIRKDIAQINTIITEKSKGAVDVATEKKN